MPPSHLAPSALPPTGRYLSVTEREQIALSRARGEGVREIARQLKRAASTISRELRRNGPLEAEGSSIGLSLRNGMQIGRHVAPSLLSWRAMPGYGRMSKIGWPEKLSALAANRSAALRYFGMGVVTDHANIEDGPVHGVQNKSLAGS